MSHQYGNQRWARVPPHLAWKRPGLPTDWVRVLERHPDDVEAMPGYVWIDAADKVRHVGEHELEFTQPGAPSEEPAEGITPGRLS